MSRAQSLYHVERQVLHTAMVRASSLPDMPLQTKHFANEQHAEIWSVIQSLAQEAKPFDPVSVADAAEREGLSRGTQTLVIEIAAAQEIIPARDARYPAGLLVTGWRDRETLRIARELADEAGRREDGAADRAITSLMALHADEHDCEHTAKTAMQQAWAEVVAAHEAGGRLIGVTTGIEELDDTLGGLHDSDLIVIGARPAMGKTGLLLGMTAAASKFGSVGLISGEQPASQVGLRWMAAGSNVSVGRLRAAKIEDDQWGRLTNAVSDLGGRPIRLLDRSSPDIAEVIRVARRWKHQYGIKALYVDYLQKLEISGMARAPKHERIGAIARMLKNLARDLNIPVVALAQVNRKVEERQNQRPMMSDLADSSEIEKEADQIMMLWRDLSNPQAETAAAEINVVKNRHGNIGTVNCLWRGASTSFVSMAPTRDYHDGRMAAAGGAS
ncbi:replicative DNA helicase [Pseudoxanthomonas sangjuensis]|uniref:replicative DNA helicase n=1 Tax=Pseudoxanthomonas sangjuensis TaxID=1503750 RepID=UPI0013916FE9|nr:DnaB-like helicase C-terminal domain-containing protein [Pseudoxanthomonas sangjuensis]KAF1713882.1 helicase DnaB [Pseudoxanthomonas sangjuensis]